MNKKIPFVLWAALWLVLASSPARTQSPAPPPEMKAFNDAQKITEPQQKLAALEKVAADFPKSSSLSMVNQGIFDTLVKNFPDQTEKILAQAKKLIESAPETSRSLFHNTVAAKLLEAGILLDEAEDFASEGLTLIDEDMAKLRRRMRATALSTLGQIYLKRGRLEEAEKSLKEAYEANPSLGSAAAGLAELAEKAGNLTAALDYLTAAALAGPLSAESRKRLESIYRQAHNNSLDGLEEMLDAKYKQNFPNPVAPEHYTPPASRSDRVVLAEIFTGSGCPPCVAADLAFDAALERYPRKDLAVVMYHLHIPRPDPMTNPSTETRSKFYGVRGVPSFMIDGEMQSGGGSRENTKMVYDRINPTIEKRLEIPSEAQIELDADLQGSVVKVKTSVDPIKSDSGAFKLQIALVEELLRYTGENGVRFHPMVVRSLGGAEAGGFTLEASKPAVIEYDFDLSTIGTQLQAHLDDYEVNGRHGRITFSEKKHTIDPANLSVVAFIQDEKTKQILQATYIKVQAENQGSHPGTSN